MIDKDLTIPSGDEPEFSVGVGSNNDTDDNYYQAHQEYSQDDPYFYLYTKNRNKNMSPYSLWDLDQVVEDAIRKGRDDNDINDPNGVGGVLPPTLSAISDSEIRLNALKLISDMRGSGTLDDAEAVISGVMSNLGVPREIVADVWGSYNLSQYIESNIIKEENSQLKGKEASVPISILQGIQKAYNEKECRETPKLHGKLFAKNVLDTPRMSYGNCKRVLNRLKSFGNGKGSKPKGCLSHRLYGGDEMESFLSSTLSMWRDSARMGKSAASKAGKSNSFIKSHDKPGGAGVATAKLEAKDYRPSEEYPDFFGYSDGKPLPNLFEELDVVSILSFLEKNDFLGDKMLRELAQKDIDDRGLLISSLEKQGYVLYPKLKEGKYRVFIPKRCWRVKASEGIWLVDTRACQIEYRDNEQYRPHQ